MFQVPWHKSSQKHKTAPSVTAFFKSCSPGKREKRKKFVSLENAPDKAVKMINFMKSQK